MRAYRNVYLHVQDRIAVVRIDHPPVNALDAATFGGLSEALESALADDSVKVIVITGTGQAFVAGADVGDLSALSSVKDAREKAEVGQALYRRIERSPKPVIAAINGRYCLGGGNELALACHIRIAEEKVKLGQPEIRLGLIPGWGATQRLARLIGAGRAIGLVNRVVPKGEALNEALRLAKRLTTLSGVALTKALDAFYAGMNLGLDEGLAYEAARFGEMAATEDMREGLRAFLEKRTPEFRDR